jgi:hypothetical protein
MAASVRMTRDGVDRPVGEGVNAALAEHRDGRVQQVVTPGLERSGAAEQAVGPVQVHGPHRDQLARDVEAPLRPVAVLPTADHHHMLSLDAQRGDGGSRCGAAGVRPLRRRTGMPRSIGAAMVLR